MRIILAILVCLPAGAQALKCKQFSDIWTPDDQLPPQALLIADASFGQQIEKLQAADVHFLADGKRVEAKIESLGRQATIRPAAPLSGTVKLAGLPSSWPQDRSWTVVERKLEPAQWTADPVLVDKSQREIGRYGVTWRRTFSAPIVGARLMETKATFRGKPVVRYRKVADGKFSFRAGPCGGGTPLDPGPNKITVTPVDKNGVTVAPKQITVDVPRRR